LNTEQILATDFCNGSTHDFQLFKESGSAMSPQICALADSGYQGLAALHSNSQTPAKKTKLHPLSKEQKDRNRAISKERILIENIIRKLKIFRILSERYRNRRKRFGLRFNLIAAIYNLELKKALERTYARGLLNGGPGLGQKVNCTDSANTVSTLANLVGCDLWQCRMGWSFALNSILAIGYPPPNPWPQWGGFSYHEVPWKGACTENDRMFDGCLMVDGDSDPTTAPHTWLLPTNMLFGDCTAMNYRRRLSPPGANGCAKCQPQPSTRQRRPVS
jgi:transposase